MHLVVVGGRLSGLNSSTSLTDATSAKKAPTSSLPERPPYQGASPGEKNQVYIERYDGQGAVTCLTCSGPGSETDNVNGVPAVSPDGKWIIFHSWRGHNLTIGSPGYGGMGSALWAMHPDGSDQTQLTDVQPAGATPGGGEGIDDYHAYWSPDGTHIEYAHLNWNFITGGGEGKWDVRVAELHETPEGAPYLSNTKIVRPDNGHWYETQWWNPNPKTPGFLYTETCPASSESGAATTPQLFYCRLIRHYSECRNGGERLTDSPSWDEQAIFTPTGKDVIFMSSRAHPGIFNTWAQTVRTLGVPNDYDYLLILPLFEAGFLQPVGQEATDLYEVPLAHPEQVRRLTTDGDEGWITPEFTWDPTNSFLMWTENRFPDGCRYQFASEAGAYVTQAQALLSNVFRQGKALSWLWVQRAHRLSINLPTGSLKQMFRSSGGRTPRGLAESR